MLNTYDQPPFAQRRPARPGARSRADAEERVERVRHPDPVARRRRSRTLSGGNQQKVVRGPRAVPAAAAARRGQPTRGVDVGLDRVHPRPDRRASATPGTAVLIVSTELDEVVGARRPDRGDVPRPDRRPSCPPDTSREELGLLMAGVPTRRRRSAAATDAAAAEARSDVTTDGPARRRGRSRSRAPAQPAPADEARPARSSSCRASSCATLTTRARSTVLARRPARAGPRRRILIIVSDPECARRSPTSSPGPATR